MEGLECQAEVSVHLIERAKGCLKVHPSSVHCAAMDRVPSHTLLVKYGLLGFGGKYSVNIY